MYGQSVRRILGTSGLQEPPTYDDPLIKIPGIGIADTGPTGFANMEFTADHLVKGTALIGATGSGKSYCLSKMIKDLRYNMIEDYSMIIIQAKNDFNSLMKPGDLVIEQGVNSNRSVRWSIFRDILSDGYDMNMIELNTREFVAHLFADKKDSKEQFFVQGARELMFCVIISYIKRGLNNLHARKQWSNRALRDFFLQFDEHSYMRLIEDCGESGVLNMILGNRGNGDNLQALGVFGELVTTALQTLIDVFADDGDFSIREFVRAKDKKALFINYDMAYKASQVPIYGSLVNLMLKEVLSQNNNVGKTILICDELVTMGKTDIAQAVNLGRAKGLMVIVGLQSIEQLKSIYGEHDAIAMLAGMCNKLYFRANDPTTRNYIKEDFGKTISEYMVLSPGGCMSERREGFLGILIGESEHWNKGYGTETIKLMLEYCFDELNCHRVGLTLNSENSRAKHCYEKAGLKECGRDHESLWSHGHWQDLVRMEILEQDFRRLCVRRSNEEATLAEVIAESFMHSDGKDFAIEDYLDDMPAVRASVDEILDCIGSYDGILDLYVKLFTDFASLLNDNEKNMLKRKYEQNFDLPLPCRATDEVSDMSEDTEESEQTKADRAKLYEMLLKAPFE